MTARLRILLMAASAAVLLSVPVWARAVTRPLGKEGEKVEAQIAERHGWPEGTLALVNHPLRHIGWKFIMGTEAGDETSFAFTPRKPGEVQTVVNLFAELAGERGSILLAPGNRPPDNFATLVKPEADAAIVFRIGSQKLLDEWFARLPIDASGKRVHAKRTYSESPRALAPTLTIYVGNAAVDLSRLEVTPGLRVSALVPTDVRDSSPEDPNVQAIDAFVARHGAKAAEEE